MSNTCVELAILHLKDKVANPIGELEKSSEYQRALAVLKKQPGLSHFRVGRWQENMNDVYWLVEWDMLGSHHAFMNSAEYKPFLEYLQSLCESRNPGEPDIDLHHFSINTRQLHNILSSPTTEIFTLRVLPPKTRTEFMDEWSHFGTFLKDKCHAEISNSETLEDERMVTCLVGWPSRERHLEWMEKPWFQPEVNKYRGGWEGAKLGHVDFHEV